MNFLNRQLDRQSRNRLFPILLFLLSFVMRSPILVHFGLKWSIFSIFLFFLLIILSILKNRKINSKTIIIILILCSTAIVPALYWSDFSKLFFTIYVINSLILLSLSTYDEIIKVVDTSSRFIIVLIIGAFIGFLLLRSGFPILYSFPKPNHDSFISVLPFSFAGSLYDISKIRMMGIYDEPGAFSFMICIIAYWRNTLKMNEQTTWVILLLGFINFSLAHLVFVVVYFIVNGRKIFNFKVLIIVAIVIFYAFNSRPIKDSLEVTIFNRLSESQNDDRIIQGDNRSLSLFNALNELKSSFKVVLFGVKPDKNRETGIGENPLSPLAQDGIFISWPFYIYIFYGLFSIFKYKRNVIFVGVILLLFQRPYVLSFGYSTILVISMWIHINARRLNNTFAKNHQ